MKIYFAGSIRGGRDDQKIYSDIINLLQSYGAVLTEHIGLDSLSSQGERLVEHSIYERDMQWVTESDVVVAEVSTSSLGVGFEIGVASYAQHKPVLCLYRSQEGKRLSAMIRGCSLVETVDYQTVEELPNIFDSFFEKVS